MWESSSVDYVAKHILADVGTWMIIYGAAFIGQLVYASMPLLIVKLYSTKINVKISKYEKKHKALCDQWGIDLKYNGLKKSDSKKSGFVSQMI